MLKKLTRKFVILSALIAALAAVSSTPVAPAAHAKGGVFCVDAPLDTDCTVYWCCDEYGNCWCSH